MKLFSSLGGWFSSHKKLGIAALVVLVVALGVGGFFAFQEYQRRQTSAFALETLQKALTPPDPHTLAKLIDFNSLSGDMARAGREVFPFLHDGSDPERSIGHTIQKALLKKFMEKESSGSQFPEDESEMVQLQKPLELLPRDFITQLLKGAKVRDTGPNTALITVPVENPQLKHTFELELELRRDHGEWKVVHLTNARAMAQALRETLLARHIGLRNVFLAKNADTTKKMNEAIPVQSCTADAGVLSDGKTFVMIVHATAKNNSNVQINNFNLDASVYGKNGTVVWRRFLNAAKPVPPGAVFDHRWSFELSASDPLVQQILQQRPLQCRSHWQTLSLASGQVWHIAEVPNPDQPCGEPGHQHPAGFCMLPTFQK